jgi:triosephosphate isomerase (TIM)
MQAMKKLAVLNWKMNPVTAREAEKLAQASENAAKTLKNTQVWLAPPAPFFSVVRSSTKKAKVGFQNGEPGDVGSVTGEISMGMEKALKASFVIIGHSEQRARGETDDAVSQKVSDALSKGLVPIVCIGETERDSHGEYLSFLESQIVGSLRGLTSQSLKDVIVAYEPVWAIGNSAAGPIGPHELHEASLLIKKIIAGKWGKAAAGSLSLLYGGSVSVDTVGSLARAGHVRGFLIGRASLDRKTLPILLEAIDNA